MRFRFALFYSLLWMSLPLVGQTAGVPNKVQTGSNQQEATPTFHATSRLVLVDVVVTSKKGEFVRDLKAPDFTVLEDGKPQRVTAFAAHASSESASAAPPIQLPPHQFTNYNAPAPEHPITVILLDMLNTQIVDRAYARQQMLKFLSSLPPGQPVALFTLGSKLQMIQGFTQSSDALVAAAKALVDKNESAHLQTTEEEMEDAEATDAELAAMAGRSPATAGLLSQALEAEQDYQMDIRVRSTLATLQALAQSVAGYPGRKNLIWLSGSFPIALGPEAAEQTHLPTYLLYQREVNEAVNMLSSSQIAVYPIDVRGLQIIGMSSSLRRAPNSDQINRQASTQIDTEFTMNDIARETGGEAFYNQNDLKALMQRSLDEGTNYYTLAYVPENHDWNGKYRRIEVKVASQATKIRHRRGYYAVAEQSSDEKSAGHLLVAAMQPTVPESTRLLMRVQVLPPTTDHKTVAIDFAISPKDLAFSDGPEQRKLATVDFMAVALDKNLKEAALQSNTVDASLRAEMYQNVLKRGFPGHIDLELKPGRYVLRLGAIDRNSQKIGTVDVRLDVPSETAQK